MTKLLVVKVNPKITKNSVGLTVGEAFVNAYKKANPNDEVTETNLYERFIPEIDGNILAAWGELEKGKTFDALTKEQQKLLEASELILEEFLAHDKYVFITPLWNLSYPARLKSYIDALCVSGKTFRYTDKGPKGLIKGKKALHIHASGGFHQGAHADKHLRDILKFIGIDDITTLLAEGHDFAPDKASELIEQAKEKARALGSQF